jgi:KTSC domain
MPSSVVSAIRYYAATSTLRIIFVSGRVYDYKDVPEKVFNAMKTSSSRGIYFNQHIKGYYEFEKVK